MASREKSKKMDNVEMRLYELLGIKLFRQIILLVEKIRHLGKSKRNENYHPQDKSIGTLTRFLGYLIYNAAFHIVSILFVILYFVLSRTYSLIYLFFDVAVIAMLIIDVYCLILQRYIYLRFQQQINKRRNEFLDKKTALAADVAALLEGRSVEETDKELEFLHGFQQSLLFGEDVFLVDDCKRILANIASAVSCNETEEESCADEMTFSELLSSLPSRKRVVSAKRSRASRLQNLLHIEKNKNVLFGVCVVTADSETEELFKKIFPDNSLDSVSQTTEVLVEAYRLHRNEVVMR